MSTAPPHPISDADYHRLTGALLARIEARADQWLQDDVVDIDTQRTGGLLELSFPGGSKIVVNTQPPLHEVWLAARGGGYHYRYDGAQWVDTRDGSEFLSALSHHASLQAGKTLQF
ncbi:iron donor protein CyaY [Rubrivivax sp. RP6-9]|uniref:iron donor protein CyaY n=1 Tax=Rubrivivax sp. RP6-9 TaxID=3415750 RepID=UPI003CC68177